MDEHRLGLHPILRRVWVDKWFGSLSAPVHCRYDWFWLYGFVHPRSGQTYWWWLPRVNIDLFNRALADLPNTLGLALSTEWCWSWIKPGGTPTQNIFNIGKVLKNMADCSSGPAAKSQNS